MNTRLRLFLAAWVLLLLVGGGGIYWYVSNYNPEIVIGDPNIETDPFGDPFFKSEELMRSTAYQEIASYFAAGHMDKVNELYVGLKATYATGTPEREVIDLDHAFFSTFSYGDPLQGVRMLKAIIIDPNEYDATTRALAIEAIARAVATYGDPAFEAEVFEGEPFADDLEAAGNSVPAATVLLYEEAMKIRPTPLASARVAQEKGRLLFAGKDTLAASDVQQLRAQFNSAMALADDTAKLVEGRQGFGDYNGVIGRTKGAAYAYVYYAQGNESDKAQADAYFRKSIQLSQGISQTFGLYHYAVFLSRTNAALSDVDAIVRRIIQAQAYERKLIEEHFVNTYKNSEAAQYADLMDLMGYSQVFSAYVLNLVESDATSS